MADVEKTEKPSLLKGVLKGAAAAVMAPVMPLALPAAFAADDDVRSSVVGGSYGAAKNAIKSFGGVPSEQILGSANLAGSALDAVTGEDGPDSTGRRIVRSLRGKMQSEERDNSAAVMAGELGSGLAMGFAGGLGGTQSAAVNATGKIASVLGSGASGAGRRIAANATADALTGGATAAMDGVLEDAHKQLLDEGHIDYGKATAAGVKSGLAGLVIGGGMGAAIHGGVEALSHGGKAAEKLRSLGVRQFGRDAGISAQAQKELDAQAEGRLKTIFEDAAKAGDHPSDFFASKAEDATKRAAEHAQPARDLLDRLNIANEQRAADAATVARRNSDAAVANIGDGMAAEIERAKAPIQNKIGASEAAVDAAQQRMNAAREALNVARSDIMRQKTAELNALKSVDPAADLRAAIRSEYQSSRQKLAAEIRAMEDGTLLDFDPKKAELVSKAIEHKRNVLGNLLDSVETKYEPKIAAAEAKHAQAIAEVHGHLDDPSKLIPKELHRELAASERAFSKHLDAHRNTVESLSEKFAKEQERIQAAYNKRLAEAQRVASSDFAAIDAHKANTARQIAEDLSHLDNLSPEGIRALEKKYTGAPDVLEALRAARLAAEEANTYKSINAAMAEKQARPLTGRVFDWVKKKSIMEAGAGVLLGGPVHGIGDLISHGVGGMAKGAAIAAVDSALSHFYPTYKSSAVFKAARLAEAVGSTLQVDTAARATVDHLFGTVLPLTVAGHVPGFLSSREDASKATQAHVTHMAMRTANAEAIRQRLEDFVANLPEDGQGEAAAKLSNILANVKSHTPKPVIQPGPFGEPAMFSDSDIYDYEDYVTAATDPAAYMRAVRSHSATPAMLQAMNENWPEILETMRDQFIQSGGKGSPDPQSVRQLEMMFGGALLPENKKENVDFVQRFWDANNRKNQPGGQGGGNQATSGQARSLAKGVKNPTDTMSAAR